MGSEVQEERRGPSSSMSVSSSRSKPGMGSENLSPLVDLPRSPSPALLDIEVDPDQPVKLEAPFGHHGIEVTFDSDSDSDSEREEEEEESEAEAEAEVEDNNVAR
ncbi:hypothetical protein JCM24511_05112 [Saitozyma sp. JCM 24511]|nr:hypothetical protein JCM24511_05112 [Saitozyma sp. JCM 24511]